MAQLLDPEQWGRGPAAPSGADQAGDERPPGPRRSGVRPPGTEPAGDWDPFAEDAAPSRGATAPSAPPPRRSGSRLPVILTVVLVVLALVAGAVWAAASGLLPFGNDGGAAAPETPAASAPASDEPEPSATPSTPAAPAATPLPASCDELFSESMRGTIEGAGLALNPQWYVDSGDLRLPSEDPELAELLGSLERLDCTWAQPEGGGGVGIFTSISQVTEEQAAAANARMQELGYTAIEELGGVRYVTETTAEGNTIGESQLIRDGLWFGTLWLNSAPSGYTADMVTQALG